MLPTDTVADRPLRARGADSPTPHKGATRGNKTNSSAISGNPKAAMRAAVRAATRSGVALPGTWAFTRAVSKPNMATSI